LPWFWSSACEALVRLLLVFLRFFWKKIANGRIAILTPGSDGRWSMVPGRAPAARLIGVKKLVSLAGRMRLSVMRGEASSGGSF
jgi:hypothetical protein